MNTNGRVALIFCMAVCIAFVACGGGGSHSNPNPSSNPTLTSLLVSPAPATVPLGSTTKLALKGVYSDGSTKAYSGTVTWSSSAPNIALVDTIGAVTGKTMGNAKVTATSGSMTASCDVTISAAELTKIDIGPSTTSTPANTIQQYIAYGTYSDGTVRDVTTQITWTSSDDTLAKVVSPGIVNALKVGTATLTGTMTPANLGKVSSTATLNITGDRIAYMAVIPYQPVIGTGMYQRFLALGQFGTDYTNHKLVSVAWSESSGGTVATLDPATGLVQALAAGRTKITATFDGVSDSVDLTVVQAGLHSIEVVPSSAQIANGTTRQFTAVGTLEDGSTQVLQNVTWTSDRTDLATIDSNGLATGKGTGDAKISATLGSSSTTASLKVTGTKLVSMAVTPQNPTIPILDKKQFYATGEFDDGTTQDLTGQVTWVSSDPSVAMITASGVANSLRKDASSTITASLEAVTASTLLRTSVETVDSVTVSPGSLTVPRGIRLQYALTGTIVPSGTKQEFELARWWSSPINAATVDSNGLATARTLDNVHTIANAKIWGESCCRNQYADLTVNNAEIVSLEITWDPANSRMQARAHFSDGSAEPNGWDVTNAVHWTSSNPAVATVDHLGSVTKHGAGTTSINATFYPVPGSTAQVSATPFTLTVAVN